MGKCEIGFRDYFLEYNNPNDYDMKFKKSDQSYEYQLIYQLPVGASGATPSFNAQYLKY